MVNLAVINSSGCLNIITIKPQKDKREAFSIENSKFNQNDFIEFMVSKLKVKNTGSTFIGPIFYNDNNYYIIGVQTKKTANKMYFDGNIYNFISYIIVSSSAENNALFDLQSIKLTNITAVAQIINLLKNESNTLSLKRPDASDSEANNNNNEEDNDEEEEEEDNAAEEEEDNEEEDEDNDEEEE